MRFTSWLWIALLVGPRTAWWMALAFYGAGGLVAVGFGVWVLAGLWALQ